MPSFIRSLCITICYALFNFIPKLYKLFYDLASNHDLFSSETVETFSRNIYVLVSVVMLFAFAVKAIESIINPDMLFDSKKGFVSVIKRSAIALLLIVIVPFGFDLFYKFQDEVMSKSLIEKIIIGVVVNEDGTGSENLAEKSGAGQMLASTALSSVLYPADKDTCKEYEDSNVCEHYNEAMLDISKLYKIIPEINEKIETEDGEDYILTYEGYGLLSVVIGGVMIYMLVLFCIDTALRLIKLGFLEITAPISIIAYIFGGNDILKKWFDEVKSSALSLFARVAALALMIFVLSALPEFVDNNFDGIYGGIINLLIIIATLMFVKEAPSLIEKIFGVKVGGKGGIAGRLGSMAGVGDVAKNAWEKMRNVGGAVIGTGLAAAGIAGAAVTNPLTAGLLAAGGGLAGASGKAIADKLRGTKVAEGLKTTGGVIKSMSAEKNPVKGVMAGVKSYNESPTGIARKQAKTQDMVDKIKNSVGVDQNGKVSNAIASASNYNDVVNKSNDVAASLKSGINDRHDANLNKALVEGIKKKSDSISDKISDAQNLTQNESVKRKLSDLDYLRKNGKITTSDFASSISLMKATGEISDSTADGILKDLSGVVNLSSAAGLTNTVLENDKLNMGALNAAVNSATNAATNAQGNFDALQNASTDKQKTAISAYADSSDKIVEQYVKDSAKSGVDYASQYSQFVGPLPSMNNSGGGNNSGGANNSSGGNNSGGANNSSGGNSSGGANNSSGGNNSGGANNSSGGNNSSNDSSSDLSSFFDTLSQDIKDANSATNDILDAQLKAQQSMLDESKKQNTKLEGISNNVGNIKGSVETLNKKIDTYGTQANKNLQNIEGKIKNDKE